MYKILVHIKSIKELSHLIDPASEAYHQIKCIS
jgi:hypothetical protein